MTEGSDLQTNKSAKWRILFIALSGLQVIGVAVFFLIMAWALQQAEAGVSGTEYISLFLFMSLIPVVGLVAVINLISLPLYIQKYKPRGKTLVFSWISLTISAVLALYGVYIFYQYRIAAPQYLNEVSSQAAQESAARQQQFLAGNTQPEISKDKAISPLKNCQLKGLYYTNQTDESSPANGGWGELSSTGVVLTKVEGKPYRISIADRFIPELVPIAREAQKTCDGLQFWHDGSYEQWQDGHWYFDGQVVN